MKTAWRFSFSFTFLSLWYFFLLVGINGLDLVFERDCGESQFFDTASLRCLECGENQESDGAGGCKCKAGYRMTSLPSDSTQQVLSGFACVDCLGTVGTEVASQDRTVCMRCGDPSIVDGVNYFSSSVDTTSRDCVCADPSTQILVEKDISGEYFAGKVCISCPSPGYITSDDSYTCNQCEDENMVYISGSCQCSSGYELHANVCLATARLAAVQGYSAAYSNIKYYNVIRPGAAAETRTLESPLLETYFLRSAIQCEDTYDRAQCQLLGNMCVFQTFLPTASACAAYLAIADSRNTVEDYAEWPQTMPWLYYQAGEAQSVLASQGIGMDICFSASGSCVARLTFVLAKYAVTGEFLGYERLTDQLQLCEGTPSVLASWIDFGTSYYHSCNLNLKAVAFNPTYLYDAYILDESSHLLEPIPVRVTNYHTAADETPNTASGGAASADDILTRRFFVIDTVSSEELIRVATTIKLVIEKQPDSSRIYPPHLEISYTERYKEDVGVTTTTTSSSSSSSNDFTEIVDNSASSQSLGAPKVEFRVEYTMDLSGFWQWSIGFFTVGVVVTLILSLFKVYSWSRRHQKIAVDFEVMYRGVLFALTTLSTWMFWLLFIFGLYWFIFFKLQSEVFVLLPSRSDLSVFYTVLMFCFVGKVIHVGLLIFEQVRCDVFLIDWEKSRGKLIGKAGETARPSPISIWRTLFVANEWNELQTLRKVNLELMLFALLFFLRGLKLEYLATPQPDQGDLAEGETHPILRFAVVSMLWVGLALLQIIYQSFILPRFVPEDVEQFVDLLSVANVSIFLLPERYYGYYLHGRSVHDHSDCNMSEMKQHLMREENAQTTRRGLVPDTDLQTYEMHLTETLRNSYDQIFLYLIQEQLQSEQQQTNAGLGARLRLRERKAHRVLGSEKLMRAYASINRFLTQFIEHILEREENDYVIHPRNTIQRMLDTSPDVTQFKKCIFYEDTTKRFTRTFFYGIDSDLLLFNILLYTVVDAYAEDTFLAVLITFLVEILLRFARSFFGQRNLAAKTLVDERFLI